MLLFSDLITGSLFILFNWLTRLSKPGLKSGKFSGLFSIKVQTVGMSLFLLRTTSWESMGEAGFSLPFITFVPFAF